MKAAVRDRYGTPDVLRIEEVDVPTPADDELLVRVEAATVNRTDCALLTGKPLVMRAVAGFVRPRRRTTGTDFAGEVVRCGARVHRFKEGDRVTGFDDLGLSSHAEYLVIRE